MDIPKWEKPKWVNLTIQQIKNMPETEIRQMLKDAMRHVKLMPDSVPWKKYMIEMGQLALKMNKFVLQIEKGVSEEEREAIDGEMDRLRDKAIQLMTKIVSMQENPLGCIERIIEITEEIGEDPWSDGYSPPVPEPVPTSAINQVEDFDPWAISNEL